MQVSFDKREQTEGDAAPARRAHVQRADEKTPLLGDEKTPARADRFADLSAYTFKQRLIIRAADLAFYVLINLIGRTTRFRVEGWEHWEAATRDGGQPIYTFWHNRVFLATYFWRRRGIVVMTSQSFDGEYIARFIQRFGYGASRGSSSRGAVGALVEMVKLMRQGRPTAFTIDGPRGPRYVAKMGAVLLAKKTGKPILPFSINSDRYYSAPSWDAFQVPYPFTRARVLIAPPIYVPADADEPALEAKRDELQRALDALNEKSS
ncbi:MAG TPA: lysophospholipid acyltransferase family protein [Pyrinomonadaceae bacterium]|nr:lysophospholipid acyltransferase family protein [Pyrinomonadaceae bacterium]